MKLLDKIKDLFMDEITDDEEIELEEERKEEYKEPPKNELPKVMRETISREEMRELKKNESLQKPEAIEEKKEVKKEEPLHKKFNFPIDFDIDEAPKEKKIVNEKKKENVGHTWDFSEDFLKENKHTNVNVLELEKETNKKVSELYANKRNEEKDLKPRFKASPVISPVYGILDKNYTKEEVREKSEDETMKRPSKKVDFETVRKKAFGNLVDDIKDSMLCENCELYKEVKKISALKEDDLLYDMTVDEEEEDNNEVTIEKAYDDYEEFGVAYEPTKEKKKPVQEEPPKEEPVIEVKQEEEPLNNFSSFKSKIEKEEVEIISNVEVVPEEKEDESTVPDVPSRSEKKNESKKEEKVDEDFFELIDSMYKERVDE